MAEDFYFTQSGAGSHTGTSLANAWSVNEASTAGNWGAGAGKISPGDTLHVSGVITTLLTIQGSGTAGNVITILFDSGASLSPLASTCCSCQNKAYITFNGGGVGIVENTDNGTLLGNQVATSGILASGSSHLEIKGITFRNLYVNDPTQDPTPDFSTQGAIYFNGVGDGISIHDNSFDNICWVLNFQGGSGTGIEVYDNAFTNYDHGLAGLGGLSEIDIYGNDFGATAAWDTPGNLWHHDGIHVFFGAGVTCTGLRIYRNRFHGDWGVSNTAHIFIEGDYTHGNLSAVSGVLYYNNLHLQYSGNLLNNGFIAAVAAASEWYNNTFLGTGVSVSAGVYLNGPGHSFENNLISGVNTFLTLQPSGTFSSIDNNLYAALASGGNSPYSYQGTPKGTLALWRTATGGEANSSQVSSAGVSSDGALLNGSAAIGAGIDESAIFTTDILGRTRVVPWDIGAYAFGDQVNVTTLNATTLKVG